MTGSDIVNWSVDADVLDRFRREHGPDPSSIREEAETAMADHCGHSRVARLYEVRFPPEDDHREAPSESETRKKKRIDFERTENFGKRIDAEVADAFRSYTKQHTDRRYGEELSHALYAHLAEPLDETFERRLREAAGEEVPDETANEPLAEEEPDRHEKPIEALPGAENDIVVAPHGPVDVRSSFDDAVESMQRETREGIKDWKALGPRVQEKAARAIHHLLDEVFEPLAEAEAPLPRLRRDEHIVPAIVAQQDSDSPNGATIEKYERIVTRSLQYTQHPVQQDTFEGEPLPDDAAETFASKFPTDLVDDGVFYLPPDPERLREAKSKTREVVDSIRRPGYYQQHVDEYGHSHGDADEELDAVADPENYSTATADD